jgi:hypothetical protein
MPPDKLTPDIVLYVSVQGSDLKFAWICGDVRRVFCRNAEALRVASVAVREVLNQIASEYVGGNRNYVDYLAALAHAGASLQSALFGNENENLEEYLKNQVPGTRLNVVTDIAIEIPWSFAYLGNPAIPIVAQDKIQDFVDFWLLRFKLRISYSNSDAMPFTPIIHNRVKTLLALHQTRFQQAAQHLNQDFPDLKDKIQRLLTYEIGAATSWTDCAQKWSSISDCDSIVYIFAHRDEDAKLCLEEKAKIGATDSYKYELTSASFEAMFKKSRRSAVRSNTLCFVNGCRTADEGWGNSLLRSTSANGFYGFIGSEAEVASDLATRYAIEFLFALLEEGKSVDEAYEETRLKCFPMSLWYSCYADPAFRIARD